MDTGSEKEKKTTGHFFYTKLHSRVNKVAFHFILCSFEKIKWDRNDSYFKCT